MSDRIRQLEDALAILQASMGSREPHPLLHRDLLGIKSGLELHAANTSGTGLEQQPSTKEDESALDIFGTLAVRDDGRATFFGSSAGQEVRSSVSFYVAAFNDQQIHPEPTSRKSFSWTFVFRLICTTIHWLSLSFAHINLL